VLWFAPPRQLNRSGAYRAQYSWQSNRAGSLIERIDSIEVNMKLQRSPNQAMLDTQEIAGFFLSEAVYPPELELCEHAHARTSFCVALDGGCNETYARKTRRYTRFALEYLPAYKEHSLAIHPTGMRSFSIEFATHWLDSLRQYAPISKDSVHLKGGVLSWLIVRLYREFRHADEVSPLIIEGLALEMLAETSRCQTKAVEPKAPLWLEKAEDMLRAHFAEHLSLSLIARIIGVHPVHLAREFRRHYHSTVGEYLRRLRIEYITSELATSDTSVVEIAAAAGFSDQSHLSRTFKRYMGMTPAKYRATVRGC
jgi:AraC family transcriptional regulator